MIEAVGGSQQYLGEKAGVPKSPAVSSYAAAAQQMVASDIRRGGSTPPPPTAVDPVNGSLEQQLLLQNEELKR